MALFSSEGARKLVRVIRGSDRRTKTTALGPRNNSKGPFYPPPIMFVAPGGGIAARSGATPGSASCAIYRHDDADGSMDDTSDTETILNPYLTAVTAGSIGWAIWKAGHYYVATESC